jgi:uncharacterized protein (DUF3084 family)
LVQVREKQIEDKDLEIKESGEQLAGKEELVQVREKQIEDKDLNSFFPASCRTRSLSNSTCF